uniref:Uncharacterized protein n=1 Tax=Mucochytrium quahogii TaxID=96639 RepID=A0A7S2SI44_9STRA|mmetsp:Transcript_4998/g.7584  ORF Transcript_4998/g.7584 Transcript_4998/m.7584 type:complete len:173 (+) Transcript_4998:1474-1992(+)
MGLKDLFCKKNEDDDPSMPNYPGAFLMQHVAFRGMIGGAGIGAGVGLVSCMLGRTKFRRALLFPGHGMQIGATVAIATVLGFSIIKEDFDEEGVKDRAFRLSYKHKQNILDRRTMIGLGGGAALGLLPFFALDKVPIIVRVGTGMSYGILATSLAFLAESKLQTNPVKESNE